MSENGLPTDHAATKAIGHPLRVKIMEALDGRVASPSELAEEFEAPLGNVSYHVRRLNELGFLELKEETPRRGAVEHYYTARVRLMVAVTMVPIEEG